MTLRWVPGWNGLTEPEAVSYVAAVEAADGQELEFGVARAINDFVTGCKQDGIWDAIKACCILAGARTLDGALVPLVGGAPTNFNFVSGDYDRETGLVGDGSTKYLDSNRAANADPQDSSHASVYGSGYDLRGLLGSYSTAKNIALFHVTNTSNFFFSNRILANLNQSTIIPGTSGFLGTSRSSSSVTTGRKAGTSTVSTVGSAPPGSGNIYVFDISGVNSFKTTARLAFYSIGESLDLAALDTRVSNLITAIGAAIP